MIWCLQLSFSCWRSRLRLGVLVSMICTHPDPLLLLLWAWLRMVWDLSVTLQHYAMTHCSTCNAYYSRCVHALGLQSIGGFDFDLLLWSGMLWRLVWMYIAELECFLHGSMQPESLACAVDMTAVVDWLNHGFYEFGWSRWLLSWYGRSNLDRLRWVLWLWLFSVSFVRNMTVELTLRFR